MVLAAERVDDPRVRPLGLISMRVERNAFGRRVDSREALLEVKGLAEPFRVVFIRAPVATEAGPGVEVLACIPEGLSPQEAGDIWRLPPPRTRGRLTSHRMFLEGLGGCGPARLSLSPGLSGGVRQPLRPRLAVGGQPIDDPVARASPAFSPSSSGRRGGELRRCRGPPDDTDAERLHEEHCQDPGGGGRRAS